MALSLRPAGIGRRAAVAAAIAVAVGLAACGSDGGPDDEAGAQGEVRVGSVAQLAQCRDWNAGTREQKLATLADVKEQINLEDSNIRTPEIPDDAAYDLIERTCEPDFAAGFRLYKIYARATGFASFAE